MLRSLRSLAAVALIAVAAPTLAGCNTIGGVKQTPQETITTAGVDAETAFQIIESALNTYETTPHANVAAAEKVKGEARDVLRSVRSAVKLGQSVSIAVAFAQAVKDTSAVTGQPVTLPTTSAAGG